MRGCYKTLRHCARRLYEKTFWNKKSRCAPQSYIFTWPDSLWLLVAKIHINIIKNPIFSVFIVYLRKTLHMSQKIGYGVWNCWRRILWENKIKIMILDACLLCLNNSICVLACDYKHMFLLNTSLYNLTCTNYCGNRQYILFIYCDTTYLYIAECDNNIQKIIHYIIVYTT
jgi:hypothetical protein